MPNLNATYYGDRATSALGRRRKGGRVKSRKRGRRGATVKVKIKGTARAVQKAAQQIAGENNGSSQRTG
jgi:hypothetical protein